MPNRFAVLEIDAQPKAIYIVEFMTEEAADLWAMMYDGRITDFAGVTEILPESHVRWNEDEYLNIDTWDAVPPDSHDLTDNVFVRCILIQGERHGLFMPDNLNHDNRPRCRQTVPRIIADGESLDFREAVCKGHFKTFKERLHRYEEEENEAPDTPMTGNIPQEILNRLEDMKPGDIIRIGKDDRGMLTEREFSKFGPRARPVRLTGYTEKVKMRECDNLYVVLNSDPDTGELMEVFANSGVSGCASAFLQWGGRLISLALRAGVSPEAIVKNSTGIRCDKPSFGAVSTEETQSEILSCPDAIGRTVMQEIIRFRLTKEE